MTAPTMTFKAFSQMNRARCESPRGFDHKLESWSLSDWFTAILGELGEAANVAKKLNRVRDGIPGNKETEAELRHKLRCEMADTFGYLDLAAQAAGFDLFEAVMEVFDAKSREIGYPAPAVPSGEGPREPSEPERRDIHPACYHWPLVPTCSDCFDAVLQNREFWKAAALDRVARPPQDDRLARARQNRAAMPEMVVFALGHENMEYLPGQLSEADLYTLANRIVETLDVWPRGLADPAHLLDEPQPSPEEVASACAQVCESRAASHGMLYAKNEAGKCAMAIREGWRRQLQKMRAPEGEALLP